MCVALLGLDSAPALFTQTQGLTMSEVVGQVAIETPEGTVSQIVDGKTIVGVNDVVRTGQDGRVILSLGDGLSIRVDKSAEVKVRDVTSDGVQLELENGRLTADVSTNGPQLAVSTARGRLRPLMQRSRFLPTMMISQWMFAAVQSMLRCGRRAKSMPVSDYRWWRGRTLGLPIFQSSSCWMSTGPKRRERIRWARFWLAGRAGKFYRGQRCHETDASAGGSGWPL